MMLILKYNAIIGLRMLTWSLLFAASYIYCASAAISGNPTMAVEGCGSAPPYKCLLGFDVKLTCSVKDEDDTTEYEIDYITGGSVKILEKSTTKEKTFKYSDATPTTGGDEVKAGDLKCIAYDNNSPTAHTQETATTLADGKPVLTVTKGCTSNKCKVNDDITLSCAANGAADSSLYAFYKEDASGADHELATFAASNSKTIKYVTDIKKVFCKAKFKLASTFEVESVKVSLEEATDTTSAAPGPNPTTAEKGDGSGAGEMKSSWCVILSTALLALSLRG